MENVGKEPNPADGSLRGRNHHNTTRLRTIAEKREPVLASIAQPDRQGELHCCDTVISP
jgi:hypothetical protein